MIALTLLQSGLSRDQYHIWGFFCWHSLTLLPAAWISKHTYYKVCDGINYRFPNYIGAAIDSNELFLHDRPWISPWIKSISNELDISCHVFASKLSGHCDVIAVRLWRHQQNVIRASETRGLCVKIFVLVSSMDSLCRVRNKVMYALLWRSVYAHTRVLFSCLFPSLPRKQK